MSKDKIYRETIIHHPNGDCTLGEIQKDVTAWNNIAGQSTFGFTSKTVQALIDTIISLKEENIKTNDVYINGIGIIIKFLSESTTEEDYDTAKLWLEIYYYKKP